MVVGGQGVSALDSVDFTRTLDLALSFSAIRAHTRMYTRRGCPFRTGLHVNGPAWLMAKGGYMVPKITIERTLKGGEQRAGVTARLSGFSDDQGCNGCCNIRTPDDKSGSRSRNVCDRTPKRKPVSKFQMFPYKSAT